MIAADLMTENPRSVHPDDTIAEAYDALQAMDVRHLPVVNDDGELVGIVSDRDIGPIFGPELEREAAESQVAAHSEQPVASIMRGDVICVEPDADIGEVIEAMVSYKIGAVPVVDGEGQLAGIISYVDILRAIAPQELGATS